MGRPNQDQYILPFDAAKNELLQLLRMLRRVDLGLSAGRSEGVVQLLERLSLLGNDLTERDGCVTVKAQVIAIAARIDARSTVSDKTVRNWAMDARKLGVLRVDVRSHRYGRKEWNVYEIDAKKIREVIQLKPKTADTQSIDTREVSNQESRRGLQAKIAPPIEGGNGRKWAETVTAPRAETVTAPRPEMVTAPLHCSITRSTHTPLIAKPKTADTQSIDTREVSQGAVVSAFLKLGVGRATTLVAEAIQRGCDTRSLMAIVRWYERSQRLNRQRWKKPATVLMLRLESAQPGVAAWLGWIPGERVQSPSPRVRFSASDFTKERQEAIANWEDVTEVYRLARAQVAV
jgi:hypothetical protein